VTARLLCALPSFGEVLYAKTLQRVGGWLVPCPVPLADLDGTRFDDLARRKVAGYREGESSAEYMTRVTGVTRLYFEVLKASIAAPEPLHPMWRLPRVWIWMARMLSRPRLLEVPIAPQLIYGVSSFVLVADLCDRPSFIFQRHWM
jgi:nucleoporin GLE1